MIVSVCFYIFVYLYVVCFRVHITSHRSFDQGMLARFLNTGQNPPVHRHFADAKTPEPFFGEVSLESATKSGG